MKSTKARCLVQLGLVERHAHIYLHVSKIMLKKNCDDIVYQKIIAKPSKQWY